MSFSKPNRSAATITTNRVEPAPISGICVTCLDSCPGPCEIGRSAIRGREMLYPQPFGNVTAGGDKDYPVDFSHFNIHGTCVGATMGAMAERLRARGEARPGACVETGPTRLASRFRST